MPTPQLAGLRVAFLVANEGVEQIELTDPWQAVEQAGGRPMLVAPLPGAVQAVHGGQRGARFPVLRQVGEIRVADYDGLVLPGGVANVDRLRTELLAVALVRDFAEAGKPVAATSHAPWVLIDADLVRGKRLTSWPSLRTDIRNAGGEWVDAEVVVSPEGGYPLVTSRGPADLPAFCREIIRAVASTPRHQ
jgi:protease I